MVCEKRLAGRAIFGYLGGYARFGGSGRTVIESLEIARDVARKLMEAMKSGIMSKLTCIPPSPIRWRYSRGHSKGDSKGSRH